MDTLAQIHRKMLNELASVGGVIDAIFFCPHDPGDHCRCRKPKTGMFDDISRRFNMPLKDVETVGDSLRDIQAAQAVGAKPVLVKTGKGQRTIAAGNGLDGVAIYDDLASYVNVLLPIESTK